ncbi:D-alanyl-D-alanine carboxypeptidase/D-alanyl-D-alanine-endopeptidase [Kibdelosporangium philippinense]|uniref:D-alanyl-D-alanine carboxypeptidase/D-alanyl-D-alanine-endopeptidase n=2 Tax=Kibdelosporangium philippinense TaxID=211113 RepID=A0ABS8ZNU3_9PSEU|nr:D-alanyl-D-alanine carboxypeptidase/D-alanyl-D-alanine-endopeptidase [Kibdelosporangium philippinense]MCE7009242.1 D-alanyl-D-alanine carboxypeptidase/D-alanyl-D-alanine-endopeptidase [Kibdelosporangium philippinense]
MRIEPGQQPKPAQLKSDPPGGAATWFESPGELPRAMPMRIEPGQSVSSPKPVTAKDVAESPVSEEPSSPESGAENTVPVQAVAAELTQEDGQTSDAGSSEKAQPQDAESVGTDGSDGAVGESADSEAAQVQQARDAGSVGVDESADSEVARAHGDAGSVESEAAQVQQAGDAGPVGTDEPVDSETAEVPQVSEAGEAESTDGDGPVDAETSQVQQASDSEPASEDGPTDAEALQEAASGGPDESTAAPVDERSADLEAAQVPEVIGEEPAASTDEKPGPAEAEQPEVADNVPVESAGEAVQAESADVPNQADGVEPVRADEPGEPADEADAEPVAESTPVETPVDEEPTGADDSAAGPDDSATVQVPQVAKIAEGERSVAEPDSATVQAPQVAKIVEGEPPAVEPGDSATVQVPSVAKDEPSGAELVDSDLFQVLHVEQVADERPSVAEPADLDLFQVPQGAGGPRDEEPGDSATAQAPHVAEDGPSVVEPVESDFVQVFPIDQVAGDAPSVVESGDSATAQAAEDDPSVAAPADSDFFQVLPVAQVADAEPVDSDLFQVLHVAEVAEDRLPADSATVDVPQVEDEPPAEPVAAGKPAPDVALAEAPAEPEKPAEPEDRGETTVQTLPVKRPDPAGFGGLSRPGAERKDPEGFGGLRRPAADVGKTQPVSPRDLEGPPKPESRPKAEPVGEKTVQVRPVQKPEETKKGPDSWFSTPAQVPTRPQRPGGDKTTQLPAPPLRPKAPGGFPPRNQPMPPAPVRPKVPEPVRNLDKPGAPTRNLHAPPLRPQGPEKPKEFPRTLHAPVGPEKPKELPRSPHAPAGLEKPKDLPRPKAPMGMETSGQALKAEPQPQTEQPPPSNEDTHRAIPPLPGKKRPKRLIVLVAIVAVIALGAGVVFFVPGVKEGLGLSGTAAEAAAAPPPAPVAFVPNLKAPNVQAARPTPQGVQSALAAPAGNPVLGTLTGSVIDAVTGDVLWERGPTTPLTPASTTKVLTGAAALLQLQHSQQFSTKVVAGPQPGSVIIVGGGDATLNSLPAGKNSVFPGSARLDDLVAQVKAKGPVTQVYLDRSRYTGDDLAPGVLPGDVGEGYISPITPLMMDGARADPAKDRSPRSQNPPRAVANEFAKRIGATMAAKPEVTAPADAQVLGEVKSAPLTELVEQFMQTSDNVLADVVAREVTKASGAEPSFAGLHTAILKVLSDNGFDVTGAELSDGSGMSTNNRSPARLLAQILAVAAGDGKDPRTAKLRPLLGGLPVAGGSGTLAGRFGDGQAASGRGWLRAKTGTLPAAQINSLAGVVLDADGRILVFALMTSQSDTLAARPALDAVAAALRSCGCK